MIPPRLQQHYDTIVLEDSLLLFPITTVSQLARFDLLSVHQDSKRIISNRLEFVKLFGKLWLDTTQRASKILARKSIAAFSLRSGEIIGAKIVLRNNPMYSFLEKLILFAAPSDEFVSTERKFFTPKTTQQQIQVCSSNTLKHGATRQLLHTASRKTSWNNRTFRAHEIGQKESLFFIETKLFRAVFSSLPGFSTRLVVRHSYSWQNVSLSLARLAEKSKRNNTKFHNVSRYTKKETLRKSGFNKQSFLRCKPRFAQELATNVAIPRGDACSPLSTNKFRDTESDLKQRNLILTSSAYNKLAPAAVEAGVVMQTTRPEELFMTSFQIGF